jgi:phenylacetate-CoA ligase
MMLRLFNKIYGNIVVLRNLHGQRDVPYLSSEELYKLRDTHLRSIVRYAAETVPYYQDLFRTMKINPSEIRSVEDLEGLPFLDKEMIRKDPIYFISTTRRGKTAIPFLTSGSTGLPIKIHHDRYSLLSNIASGEREREVISKLCGRRFGYRVATILYEGNTTKKVQNLYRQWTFIPIRPEEFTLSVSNPFEEIANWIDHLCPDVLIGYGSYLETFFRALALRNISMRLPKVLVYVAEGMTAEGKSFIEEIFGIPVLSQYNAVEAFKIGFTCEERNGFHLHEDLCHVKIVDANGKKLTDGEKGEIVISNLVNHGTVLLNYRLGDVGVLSREKCRCGRTLPILSELEGRVEDILFLQDGRFIHPRAIWAVIKKMEGVLKYQLIQHAPQRFELRLVTVNKDTYPLVVTGILDGLKDLFGSSAMIESEYVEELTSQEGGKFRPVLSLCKPRPQE